jgi:hypothetical protein
MLRLIRLRLPLAIALLAAGAASADDTLVSGTAEPSSAPTNAIVVTPPAATVLPSMSAARFGHTATLLVGGRVLVAGGYPGLVTAELYEPEQQTFRPVADMTHGRLGHTATLLPTSGFVLLAGGVEIEGVSNQISIPLSAAELFIPASATFTPIHPMTTARVGATATLLGNKQVLIAGGWNTVNGLETDISSAELFDPTTRTFTRTGTMNHPRSGHADVLLTHGEVLIIGGDAAGNTAEIYNPSTGRFSPTGSMQHSRKQFTATLVSGGNVLITGGSWNGTALSSAELYDSASGRFSAIHAMSVARTGHTATALSDGTVLVAGGNTLQIGHNPCGYTSWFYWVSSAVERFNPATRQFTFSAVRLGVPRYYDTATRLLTGDVLVTGGRTLVRKLCYYGGRYPAPYELPTTTATAELIR